MEGYSSDPTSPSNAAYGEHEPNETQEALSFSSLHANQRLQSTPNPKSRSATVLHRVQRRSSNHGAASPAHPPVASSHTGTEDTEESSLSSVDVSLLDGGAGSQGTAKRPLPVREYWNNLLLDVEGNGRQGATATRLMSHAPSTGSSTLVDQESLTGRTPTVKPSSNLQAHYAQLEDQYERPSSAPPSTSSHVSPASTTRRASPLQDHISRFANLRLDDIEEGVSGSRSGFGLPSSSSTRESSLTPQPSLAASKVHDIFARHIHNASASSRSNVSGQTSGLANSSSDGRPRQRLRDLLAASAASESVQAESHHHRQSSSVTQSPSRRAKIASPASSTRSKHTTASPGSPSRRHSTPKAAFPQFSYSIQNSPSRQRTSPSPRASPSNAHLHASPVRPLQRSNSDQSLRDHSRLYNASTRLSREWEEVAARRSASLALAESTEEEEENDGDVEDEVHHHPLHEQRKERYEEREEDDFSPDLGDGYDEGQEEEEQLTDVQEPEEEYDGQEEIPGEEGEGSEGGYSPPRTEGEEEEEEQEQEPGEETREIGSAQVYIAERRASPRMLSLHERFQASASTSVSATTPARPLPPQNSAQQEQQRKTPPKTPHLPGFYHSTTPFHPTPSSSSFARNHQSHLQPETPLPALQPDQSALERSRSRLFGLMTPGVPHVPGAYSSPFPHPKKRTAPQSGGASQRQMEKRPAGTALGGISEGEEAEEGDQSQQQQVRFKHSPSTSAAARSPSTTPKTTPQKQQKKQSPSSRLQPVSEGSMQSSPSRKKRSSMVSAAAEEITPLAEAEASSLVILQQTPEKRKRTESAESAIQGLLSELVKPLRGLLGGVASRSAQRDASVEEHREGVQVQETPYKKAYADALTERRTRKTEQDLLLQQLSEADRLDRSLSSRMSEIRTTLDSMSQVLTSQVTSVLSDSFARENRRRKTWLCLAILIELLVLWAIFRFANARAEWIRQTSYYDPFFPALYANNEASLLHYPSSAFFSSSCSAFLDLHPIPATASTTAGTWQEWTSSYSGQVRHTLNRLITSSLGKTDSVHGTYSHLGRLLSAAIEGSGQQQVYRVPT